MILRMRTKVWTDDRIIPDFDSTSTSDMGEFTNPDISTNPNAFSEISEGPRHLKNGKCAHRGRSPNAQFFSSDGIQDDMVTNRHTGIKT